jgi:hypothetical protein
MDAVIESRTVEARKTGPRRNRDKELVRYVGRHGVVRIGQVMVAMDAGHGIGSVRRAEGLTGRSGPPAAGVAPVA